MNLPRAGMKSCAVYAGLCTCLGAMWMSKENVQELVLSHYVGARGIRLGGVRLYLLCGLLVLGLEFPWECIPLDGNISNKHFSFFSSFSPSLCPSHSSFSFFLLSSSLASPFPSLSPSLLPLSLTLFFPSFPPSHPFLPCPLLSSLPSFPPEMLGMHYHSQKKKWFLTSLLFKSVSKIEEHQHALFKL